MPIVVKLEEDAEHGMSESPTDAINMTNPNNIYDVTNEDEEARIEFLSNRYGHIRRGAYKMERGDVYLHMQVDALTINQGKCFYNPEQDVYYVRAKKSANVRKQKDDKIFLEVEKYDENTVYKNLTFHITGIHNII